MATPAIESTALGRLTAAEREATMRRFTVLRPHIEDGVPLTRAAAEAGIACRTLQRWAAAYRDRGLAGLVRARRSDAGRRRMPEELRHLVEGLALRRPAPHVTWVHRRTVEVAKDRSWPVPSYSTVYAIVRALDPALVVLAHEGTKRYREVYDLIHRREAEGPNAIWQADHTQLDLWVITPSGRPARPWLTVVEDDYSRAITGYAVNLGAPSALNTALALRQAIWRKPDPAWHVCGVPSVFYTDHGSDFTSAHMEQAAAELKIRLVFSLPGQPRGRGKIERIMDTVNTLCLSDLPGYAPRGAKDRAGQARLSLAELDHALGGFFIGTYNQREHGETGRPPQARWEADAFMPRMPDVLEQLDLLLLTVAKPRKVHTDGIHFQSLRYLDPTLAAYVGEDVTIRYDPRDLAEIRVFHGERFLTRAICPHLAGRSVTLKDITAARNARRRELSGTLRRRASVVDRLLAVHEEPEPPGTPVQTEESSTSRLRRYREE
ncbi:Mu transposase C-terminal domain-containing protein [Streptomyces sp. NPDC005407]|uniref:Mu transposase C-terminal domain-containing protein n=1 Tax=Streptomyces sp. NPDC005407 TaxID=3155340 RepID=UPI0033A01AB8